MGDIDDRGGDGNITNNGLVEGNIKTSQGDDTIEHSGSVNFIGAGPDDDTVILSGDAPVVEDEVCGGKGTDTLDFRMSTDDQAYFDQKSAEIQAFVENPADGSIVWNGGTLSWSNFEIFMDNLKFVVRESGDHVDLVDNGNFMVEKRGAGNLFFFGSDGSVLCSLGAGVVANATPGTGLCHVSDGELGVNLFVTVTAPGKLHVLLVNSDGTVILDQQVAP